MKPIIDAEKEQRVKLLNRDIENCITDSLRLSAMSEKLMDIAVERTIELITLEMGMEVKSKCLMEIQKIKISLK